MITIIEKGKISAYQMGVLMHLATVSTGVLLLPSAMYKFAQKDLWLSLLISSLIGFVMVFIACKLHQYFPKKTLIEISNTLLGKIGGKVIGFIFLFLTLYINGYIVREYSEFLITNFFDKTPITIMATSLTLVCSFAVLGGLEVIARCAQIFAPVVILLFLGIVMLQLPDMEPLNMLPVMDNGIVPILKGTIAPMGWFAEYTFISFLLPYVSDGKNAMKAGFISVLTAVLALLIVCLVILFILGNLTGKYLFPFMIIARYISVADFLEHVESIVMAIWIVGAFIKTCLYFYINVLGISQWLKLSEYRSLTLPVGLLLVILAVWEFPNLQALINFSPVSVIDKITGFIIPVLLLLLAFIYKKFSDGKQNKGSQPQKDV
ncbi:GerAB/ArcD/ProY family transporter [Scopulibacillus cellulosilyticus]|uniref:Endospore germination permease n=1 Tax=Scopulibacillus cellulosilyticus TaxID=2665665 RepID=A0ABW2PWY0_9BACL